ncbi:hypothetical protein DPV78_005725 [Talaromyces pinophilus]|nr:hypothetical protein DPV78_005725 [Talaromyces pinophilus]
MMLNLVKRWWFLVVNVIAFAGLSMFVVVGAAEEIDGKGIEYFEDPVYGLLALWVGDHWLWLSK